MTTHSAEGDSFGRDAAAYLDPAMYEKTRLPVSEAATLSPDAYTSELFYRVELQRLWQRSWVCVGYSCQFKRPGDVEVVEVGDQSLLVTRDKEGRLHAFHNVCRHRGSRLLEESTHCSVLRCPYHSWGYGLDGALLGAPYFQGLDVPPQAAAQFRIRAEEAGKFCKADYGLLEAQVATWGGLVFINLSAEPVPFEKWLGDLPQRYCRHPLDELELVRRKSYAIHANWKLVAENFMEYYHLPAVHPELCNISGFDNHHRYQGHGMYTGMCTSPLTVDPQTVSLDLPNFSGLDQTEAQSAYFVLLFPNLALWLFPNHLLTLLFRPAGANLTLESMDMLIHPSALSDPALDERLDRIMGFWDMVNLQDVKIVETVQKGLASRWFFGGRMCYDFEEPVHRFQNMVIDRMLGIDRIPPGDAAEAP